MEGQLLEDINQIVESLKSDLYEQVPHWVEAQSPPEFFDFEQQLQLTLNTLQSRIVRAVLESIHRDAAFVAECKRQALHDLGMQNSGLREKSVRTLSGIQVRIKTPYVVLSATEEQNAERATHRREGAGIYPVLRRLGIVRGTTPRFLAEVNRQMADGPSGAEVEERFASREIFFAQTPMWHQVRDFTCIALWQRQAAASNLDEVEVIEPAPLAGKRVVVGIDGGRLRIRVNKETNNKNAAKSYTADDCEPKLFVVYTIDAKGNKETKGQFVYDGTLQSNEVLFVLLKLRLRQLGIEQAKLLVIIGDGATWIWKGSEELRLSLGLDKIRVFEVVDFAHSVGKLTIPARLGVSDRSQRRVWLRRMRRWLKEGQIDAIIEALQGLDSNKDEDGDIQKAIKYFQNHRSRMQYALFRCEGLPIGSGVIESGVRRIVNFRLRGASLYWTPEKAEQILYLRCQIKGGRWNAFFKSVLSKWANDMSVSLTKVYQIKEQIKSRFLESHPPVHVDKSRLEAIRWAQNIIDSTNTLILDTETTGLSADDEIIQLAILDLQGNIIFRQSFKPTAQISSEAFAVHRIGESDLAESPNFTESHDTISRIVRNRNIIAYNMEFDQRMLLQTCNKYGLSMFENSTWCCAMEKYACFWDERRGKNNFKRYSLAVACKQQGITIDEAHEAVKDCLLTLQLIKVMAFADDMD